MQHESDVRRGFLPPPSALKDVMVRGSLRWPGEEDAVPLSLFLMQEVDALTQRPEAFVLLHAPSRFAAVLKEEAHRLREFLRKRQTPTFYRIDPRYGLLCGSAQEAVDPSVKWDRPGTYVALYLTDDPISPSLALLDYVPMDLRERYQQLFMKYNGVHARAAISLTSTWKRLLGRGGHAETGSRGVNYRMIKGLARFLQGEKVTSATISLIFKDVPPDALRASLLDSSLASHHASGQDRFFASLGELA